MSDASQRLLDRCREDLDAARLLRDAGHHAQSCSRAYYAAFYAAEAALLSVDETRSKHSGVIAGFNKRFVRQGRIHGDVGRALRALFERRNQADYDLADISEPDATRSLHDARSVVDAVEDLLGDAP